MGLKDSSFFFFLFGGLGFRAPVKSAEMILLSSRSVGPVLPQPYSPSNPTTLSIIFEDKRALSLEARVSNVLCLYYVIHLQNHVKPPFPFHFHVLLHCNLNCYTLHPTCPFLVPM